MSARIWSVADGPARSSSSSSGSDSFAFPFSKVLAFFDGPASVSTVQEVLPLWQKYQVLTFLLSCRHTQDRFNRRHGLQTHPSSPRQVPPFAVSIPRMVNPEAAHFPFFVSICGPAAGLAALPSSSSIAF